MKKFANIFYFTQTILCGAMLALMFATAFLSPFLLSAEEIADFWQKVFWK